MKKKRSISSYIVIALILFAVWFYRDSMQEIWWGIQQISAREILFCILLAAAFFMLDGFLIYCATAVFAKDMTWTKGIAITYICEFYRLITLGSGTFVAEIYYLSRQGLSVAQGTAVSTYKYAFKKFSIMVNGLIGFAWLWHTDYARALCAQYRVFTVIAAALSSAIVGGYFLVSVSKKIAGAVVAAIRFLAKRFQWVSRHADGWTAQIENINTEGWHLWRQWKRNLVMLFVNLCKSIVIYAVVAVLLHGECVLKDPDIIAVMAMVYFLAGVLPAPSGVMSLEYVYGLFMGTFLAIGVTAPAILTFRFFTWIFPACIGGVILLARRIWRHIGKGGI